MPCTFIDQGITASDPIGSRRSDHLILIGPYRSDDSHDQPDQKDPIGNASRDSPDRILLDRDVRVDCRSHTVCSGNHSRSDPIVVRLDLVDRADRK